MAEIELMPVVSSHVNGIGYDPETSELIVEYSNGKRVAYHQVDPHTAKIVMEAPSIGQALHLFIRRRYQHSPR